MAILGKQSQIPPAPFLRGSQFPPFLKPRWSRGSGGFPLGEGRLLHGDMQWAPCNGRLGDGLGGLNT